MDVMEFRNGGHHEKFSKVGVEMDYKDWIEFSDKGLIAYGAYNIWITKDEYDFGYKLFCNKYKSPQCLIEKKESVELLTNTDLHRMFELLTSMHELGWHPRPISIFNHKSISGIKIEKAEEATEELYNNRHRDCNYEGLYDLLNEGMVGYMAKTLGMHNHGSLNGKLVIIDVDSETLSNYKIGRTE